MSSSVDRLELLCEVNRRLATFHHLDDLLAYATARTRELLQAEGCAVLLIDEHRKEFRFPVSSQSATIGVSNARLQEIRFPSTQGIAGWVVAHDQAVAVDDVQHDPRFYSGVDHTTGAVTRSLLCAPLRTSGGILGVVEVINPRSVDVGDLGFLEALASTVAIAHEKAEFATRMRDELAELRRFQRIGGLVLVGVGILLAAVTGMATLARALPMTDVVRQPGLGIGIVVAIVGAVLLVASRRVPRIT